MIKAKYILIDISNLFRRNYEKQKAILKNYEMNKLYIEAIKHTLISINKIEREYLTNNGTIYYLFDNPTSKINLRSEISKEYKKTRVRMEEGYYSAIDNLALILQYRNDNYHIIRVTYLEADDLVKPIIQNIRTLDKVNLILLCSADYDYARSLTKDVLWYDFHDVITVEKFISKYGYTPTESSVILYKTIKGDKSDNIPNLIHNIPEKKLIDIVTKYPDAYSLIANIPNLDISDKWKNEFKLKESELRTNYLLVKYIECPYAEIKDYVIKTKLSVPLLKDLYKTVTTNTKEIDSRDIFQTIVKSEDSFFEQIKLDRF